MDICLEHPLNMKTTKLQYVTCIFRNIHEEKMKIQFLGIMTMPNIVRLDTFTQVRTRNLLGGVCNFVYRPKKMSYQQKIED